MALFSFSGNPMWLLVLQSDFVTKIVLLTLFAMSVMTWAIFLYKIILFRVKNRELQQALSLIGQVNSFDELRAFTVTLSNTLPGYLLSKNLLFLKSLVEMHMNKRALNEVEFDAFRDNADQVVDELMYAQEQYIPYLFVNASVATLLGLFGTVWGLVHAFIGISQKQSADIATVAPGLAEALITTIAGLLIAIPALVLFHYLQIKCRSIEHKLFMLSDKMTWLIKKFFMLKQEGV